MVEEFGGGRGFVSIVAMLKVPVVVFIGAASGTRESEIEKPRV
jgi:hypothetical protein